MDYVVRLTGKDDLSKTVESVKKELNEVGKATTQIDKIDAKFERITKSSAPLKRQLRDLQALMAQMNMDGLSNTDQFTKIAQQAGTIKDAIADAATATKQFSSDTLKLDAAIQGVQGIAAATSIATGAMALFGNENKEVQQAILKVQAALSILNGVQAIANTLNKDSALMQRIKQIQLAATTTATAGNTVSTVANTAAVVANTAATKAWNTAKAIGKALLGDWTGLLLVGVTSLAAYSLATSDSADKQEELNKSTEDAENIQKNYVNTLSNTFGNLMGKYKQLEIQWKSLSNVHEKNKWITENRNKLEELGISAKNINEVEAAFTNNTPKIVQAFKQRAEMAAITAKMNELYSKKMALEDELQNKLLSGDVNGVTELDNRIKGIDKEIDNAANRLVNLSKQLPKITTTSKGSNTTNRITNKTTNKVTTKNEVKVEAKEGSINALSNELTKLQNDLKNGLIPDKDILATKIQIKNLKKQIEDKEIELGFRIKKDDIVEEGNKLQEGLNDIKVKVEQYEQSIAEKAAIDAMNAKEKFEYATDAVNSFGQSLSGLGSALKIPELDVAGTFAQAIATMVQGYATATSQAAALGPWAWIAFAATGLAELTAIIASINNLKGFADGGIVGGGSMYGDKVLARVNSGEMILNKRQQKNLFNIIDESRTNSGNYVPTLKIKGSDFYVMWKNYASVSNKSGKNITI